MKLHLKRVAKRDKYTIGRLYNVESDGVEIKLCDTLEDTWRDLAHGAKKVPGETCIPDGEYEIDMSTRSPKYTKKFVENPKHALAYTAGYMPRLKNVPGFDGILIHTGNGPEHTEGCLLVGYNTEVGRLTESTMAFMDLYMLLKDASVRGDKITIKID